MLTEIQRRNQILKRIHKIPNDKLEELERLISKLEKGITKKSKVLSYAGAWKDIDEEVFDELTVKLHQNRQKNRRRIDE
ncbi:hypothetical protein [Flexithrix dorotheae]|uniref:hypothetical protein n=1 Tax=Flexithrix dorotheae TaxID=70993 RepID=UPI00037DECAF|nr:hypothetical protein [Flexithrix dorotheae]